MLRKVTGIVMNQISKQDRYAQVSVKEGVRRHGQKAVNAVLSEFAQLNDKDIFTPVSAKSMTSSDKREALNLITLVKEKRNGKIKGRACADGRKQRRYISKEEVASPTVQLHSLLLSLAIDARERRDIATADVVGAYLLVDMNDFVIVKVTGEAIDMMCKVRPEYKKFVTGVNKNRVLYLRLTKALYGCMQSALLWYNTFKEALVKMGFSLNPYDPCVANRTIHGRQCTICWYVDDMKISHERSSVVDKVIKEIEKSFGKMTVTRGTKHTFVGIDIDFQGDGTVMLSTDQYIKECINIYEGEVVKTSPTPAKGNLFDEDEGDELVTLSETEAEKFHHTVAKLLYASKRT